LIQGAGPVDGVPEFISLHYAWNEEERKVWLMCSESCV
jgi:hypothetical protein